jgi:hypothetical protein
MATALDNALGPVAAQMINQFGTTVIMRGGEVSSYNPTTGVLSKSQQEQTRKAIISSAKTKAGGASEVIAVGGQPLSTQAAYDKANFILIMARAGEAFAPEVGYEVEFNSKKYNVITVTPNFSGDLVATYDVAVAL